MKIKSYKPFFQPVENLIYLIYEASAFSTTKFTLVETSE